ncbi:hypothetical protein T440DRAFT_254731 [Plenodomus tracheiphilus IPT5]|uniref:Uncharacterized protein n=1 Tax=Plenodomus tracheiphilus IPT5 TaxID=1408161 RepID=A0A6A7ARA3_9PLEO|nr:hypothetical protein T440DRAFT_254731 [Plenodomus tracheiphilus IPT5]
MSRPHDHGTSSDAQCGGPVSYMSAALCLPMTTTITTTIIIIIHNQSPLPPRPTPPPPPLVACMPTQPVPRLSHGQASESSVSVSVCACEQSRAV